MKEYIQDTAKKAGVDGVTIYGARVKKLRKQDGGWEVTWSTLHEDERSEVLQEQENGKVRAIISEASLWTGLTVVDI